jgi:hypothetical protein
MEFSDDNQKYYLTRRGLDHLSSSSSQIVLFCFLILSSLQKEKTPLTFDFSHSTDFLGLPVDRCREFIDFYSAKGFIEPVHSEPIDIKIFNKPGLYSEILDKEPEQ